MSSMAKTLGMGQRFDYKGKEYILAPFDLEMQAMFQTWLEKRAFEAHFWSSTGRDRSRLILCHFHA